MTDIQAILEPVRHLNVWDRLAFMPDNSQQYQVLVRWYQCLGDSSRADRKEVLGVGPTEATAAIDALRKFDAELEQLESRIAHWRKGVAEHIKKGLAAKEQP